MSGRWIPLVFAVSLTAVACGPSGSAAGPGAAEPPAAARPSASESTATPVGVASPEPSPTPTVHGDTLMSGASISYDGLRVWASQSVGVAIVRVLDVGPVRWNSVSGDRPDGTALHTAPRGHRDGYNLGRLITVERVRLVAGRWPATRSTVAYWRGGGSLGADSLDPGLVAAELNIGNEAVALLTEADAGADGNLPVQVGWLFPVDASGRVVTLDRTRTVTLDNLRSFLP